MGWVSGSIIFSDIISALKNRVLDYSIRMKIYGDLIRTFQNQDCDTLDECLGEDEAFDEAYNMKE